MDFFQEQERAQRQTRLLFVYFAVALLVLVGLLNLALYGAVRYHHQISWQQWFTQPWWVYFSLLLLVVVLGVSAYRHWRLRKGGVAIALMMGARPLLPQQSLEERRLQNVVEEMAIASGMPVPDVFVLEEEPAINAFVAGHNPSDTIVCVTRGALDHLNRDELQGVLAHEFSHIFHGDTRINLRLMGLLAGLLALGEAGSHLMGLRHFGRTGISTARSRGRRGSGHGAVAVLLVGLALWIAGYLGVFMGRLIKAAVSRQREFLADAAGVQYTRNPDGLASALLKIRNHEFAGKLRDRHAEELSHLCFAESVTIRWRSLLATHPTLDDRIKKLKPLMRLTPKSQAGASFQPGSPQQTSHAAAAQFSAPSSDQSPVSGASSAAPAASEHSAHSEALVLSDRIGQWDEQAFATAQQQLDALTEQVKDWAHQEPLLLLMALLLQHQEDDAAKTWLWQQLRNGEEATLSAMVNKLGGLSVTQQQRALDLLLPELKRRNDPRETMRLVKGLIQCDRHIHLMEYLAFSLLQKRLLEPAPQRQRITRFTGEVKNALGLLFGYALHADTIDPVSAVNTSIAPRESSATRQSRASHGSGATSNELKQSLQTRYQLTDIPTPSTDFLALHKALMLLAQLAPALKRTLLDDVSDCLQASGNKASEQESLHPLLQSVALQLECPLPPRGFTSMQDGN